MDEPYRNSALPKPPNTQLPSAALILFQQMLEYAILSDTSNICGRVFVIYVPPTGCHIRTYFLTHLL